MIEDRSRSIVQNCHWKDPSEIIREAVDDFYMNRWYGQDYNLEVWCEKDAVSNILDRVCRKWDIPFLANRGYLSQSIMYDNFQRLQVKNSYKKIVIFYFGDHDPSGIDMTRDIRDRLELFFGDFVKFVDRLALNIDQITEYNPPENPVKVKDSRYDSYVNEYGYSCWELDALEPEDLSKILESNILKYVDLDKFKKIEELEEEHKQTLEEIADSL